MPKSKNSSFFAVSVLQTESFYVDSLQSGNRFDLAKKSFCKRERRPKRTAAACKLLHELLEYVWLFSQIGGWAVGMQSH